MTQQDSAPTTTWVAELEPAGVALVQLLAILGKTPVPLPALAEHRSLLPEALAEALGRDDAATVVRALVPVAAVDVRTGAVELSSDARDEVRAELTNGERSAARDHALDWLMVAVPTASDDPAHWDHVYALLDHVLAAAEEDTATSAGGEAQAVVLLERVGRYLLSRGRYAAARDVLEQALRRCRAVEDRDQRAEGAVLRPFAAALQALGASDAARRLLEEALRIDSAHGGGPDAGRDAMDLAVVLNALDRPERALEQIGRAIDALASDPGATLDLARAHRDRGWILLGEDRLDDALAELERAVEQLSGLDDNRSGLDALAAREGLGMTLARLGRFDEAHEVLEEVLRGRERVLGDDHPDVGVVLSNLAPVCRQMGDLDAARDQLERSLEIAKRMLPEVHRARFARHSKLASVLEAQGDLAAAREHRALAVSLGERLFGGGAQLASQLQQLASLELKLKDYAPAERTCLRAIEVADSVDEPYQVLRVVRRTLVRARTAQGHFTGALDVLEDLAETEDDPDAQNLVRLVTTRLIHHLGERLVRASGAIGEPKAGAAIKRRVNAVAQTVAADLLAGDNPALVVQAATLAIDAGDLDAAAQGLSRVPQLAGEALGDHRRELTEAWRQVARAYVERGDPETALEFFGHALEATPDVPRIKGPILAEIASIHDDAGDVEQAVNLVRQAVDLHIAAEDGVAAIAGLRRLADHLVDVGRADEAQEALEHRVALARALGDRSLLGQTLYDLNWILRERDDLDGAVDIAREAVEVARDSDDLVLRSTTLVGLGRALEERGDLTEALAIYTERLHVIGELPKPNRQSEGVTLHDLADVRMGLGEIDEAIELYEQALARKRLVGRTLDYTTTQAALAHAYRVRGDEEAAARVVRDRLDVLRNLTRRDYEEEIEALLELANAEQPSEDAFAHAREAVDLAREIGDIRAEGEAHLQAAIVGTSAGRGEDAADHAAAAATIYGKLADEGHLAMAHLMAARAERRDPARAFASLCRGIRAFQSVGREDEDAEVIWLARLVADTCIWLGQVELRAATEARARAMFADLDPTDLADDVDPIDVVRTLTASGRVADALAVLESPSAKGIPPTLLVGELLQVGRGLESRAAFEHSARAFEDALRIARTFTPRRLLLEAIISHDLADSRRALGEIDEAIALYRLAADTKIQDANHREAAVSLLSLARALYAHGRYDDAAAALNERFEVLGSLPEPDLPAEGVSWHDLANVRRLQGDLPTAVELYRRALAVKERSGTHARDLAVTVLALSFALRRLGAADARALRVLGLRTVELVTEAWATSEDQSPKVASLELMASVGAARPPGPRSRAATALSGLSPQAIAGVVWLSRESSRVPPPDAAAGVGGSAIGRRVVDELERFGLCAVSEGTPRLARSGWQAAQLVLGPGLASAVWSTASERSEPRAAEGIYLGAQLAVADGDVKRALALLEGVGGEGAGASLPGLAARALALRLASSARAAHCRGVGEALGILVDGDQARLLWVVAAALDVGARDVARTALGQLEGSAMDAGGGASSRVWADVGLGWHALAIDCEAAGDVVGAREAYGCAAAALRVLHVDLEIAVMRHEADMLRAAGDPAAALELESATPYAPQAAGVRVLTAATGLRAARLQALLGRPLASRVASWQTLAGIRFLAEKDLGEGDGGSASPGEESGSGADDAGGLAALSPSAIALLELLREDAEDSRLRGLRSGVLIAGSGWQTVAGAAIELEVAGLAHAPLAAGWVRLTGRGAATAVVLGRLTAE